MPLLAAAMTIAAAARITAALEKLEASVRALQPQRDDIADDERPAPPHESACRASAQRPCAFITQCLRDPETGKAFALYKEEVIFLRNAFTLTPDGELPYPEMVFSAPKKAGKTALAAWCAIYVAAIIGGTLG